MKFSRIVLSSAVLAALVVPAASASAAECLIPLLCQVQVNPVTPPAATLPAAPVPEIPPEVQKPVDSLKGLSVSAVEDVLLTRVNASRSLVGLGPLARHPWADSVARAFSEKMAAAGTIWHNMDYMATGRKAMGATALGENVAWDWTVDAAHVGLMNSPSHKANILSSQFTHVGIGIALTGAGQVFVTEDFAQIPGGASAVLKTAAKTGATVKTAASPPVAAAAAGVADPESITLTARQTNQEADQEIAKGSPPASNSPSGQGDSGQSDSASSPLKIPGIAGGVMTLMSCLAWAIRKIAMVMGA